MYLHKNNITHNDLSLDNILVLYSKNGGLILKIVNFGHGIINHNHPNWESIKKNEMFNVGVIFYLILT